MQGQNMGITLRNFNYECSWQWGDEYPGKAKRIQLQQTSLFLLSTKIQSFELKNFK